MRAHAQLGRALPSGGWPAESRVRPCVQCPDLRGAASPKIMCGLAHRHAPRERGIWGEVSSRFVGADERAYLASVGGEEAVMNIPLAIY